jgi:hypothetical protein
MTPSSAPCACCWEMSVVAREAPAMLLRLQRRALVGSASTPNGLRRSSLCLLLEKVDSGGARGASHYFSHPPNC